MSEGQSSVHAVLLACPIFSWPLTVDSCTHSSGSPTGLGGSDYLLLISTGFATTQFRTSPRTWISTGATQMSPLSLASGVSVLSCSCWIILSLKTSMPLCLKTQFKCLWFSRSFITCYLANTFLSFYECTGVSKFLDLSLPQFP